ncbi:Glycosyl hydrolase family 47 [Nesidiocoris tenuis]|uniref:alpha-1,2-Mannosidase n=2 Tax=Nesidiocoris tenuis TaxID=355587 RepID=A0ABN7A7I3_9HEMI|nr:Glycosyl hydrolase family 47 [Nesidiocoris tenuis]
MAMLRWSALRLWLAAAGTVLLVTVLLVEQSRDGDSGPRGRFLRNLKARSVEGKPLIIGLNTSDPDDALWAERRRHIVQMTKHAWDNYVRYAWGKNELRPISKRAHTGSIFGAASLGLTIVDGLDTLYIMGLHDEFKQGREWIATNLNNFEEVSGDFSVFETNIRYVGGLLTCYSLTGDVMFRDKAEYIAKKLLPAFHTPTGIPNALVNFKTGTSKNYGWASGGSSILSEFGTLHLEFSYLSDVTGNPVFREKVDTIRNVIQNLEKPKGLYPNYLNPKTGKWGQQHMSMGALGDSFYEYLLKAWIQSAKQDHEAREMYDSAIDAVVTHMLQKSNGGLTYFGELKYERLEPKMDHLACFSGGLLALGAQTLRNTVSTRHMEIAEGIANTCHESYIRSNLKLGPEAFRFTDSVEAKAIRANDKYYILRPEVLESYFYLWRLTKNQKYRDWGWEAVQALEKYCRTSSGYTGVKNVYQDYPVKDDVQQSFFIAETLKYLYLLFSDDSLISLDEWVYNTEGHPLPIKGVNPYYRELQP